MDLLTTLVDKGLRRELPTRDEALAVLATSDDELLDVVAAAGRVRRQWFGRRVKLNYLVNLKSGLCPEDCSYCSQRLGSKAEILKYTWLKPDEAAAAARAGVAGGAKRVCLVASGRGPTDRDVERVSATIAAIKDQNEDVEVCACLGLLSGGQAERLRTAGADAYNHNLNTSEGTYGDITTTHTYADRVDTVQQAQAAGLSACSGLIAGMGESDADLVDVVFSLRALDPDSVPVNFLIPFEGTPLAKEWNLTPQRCLRILAMVRFVCPDVEVRLAGGREVHLRTMQPLALHLVNSIFLGDYLTSEGQAGQADLDMIADAGFEVEGAGTTTLPAHRADVAAAGCASHGSDSAGSACGSHDGGCGPCGHTEDAVPAARTEPAGAGQKVGAGERPRTEPVRTEPVRTAEPVRAEGARTDLVTVRRRGAGTDLPPNA
jgi:biotin synthase